MTISQLQNRFKNLNINNISVDSIEETREAYIAKQKDQLLHGLNKEGGKIGKYRNPKYAQKKFNLNPLAGFGNVDLKLTGALHSAIFLDVRERELITDSADAKTGGLIEKYGDFFGLTDENKSEYVAESLRPVFMKNVRNSLKK